MNKDLFSFYMKKIYNEDAAITAASSLIDGANAATSGIVPGLLGLQAAKLATDVIFNKYTGLNYGERSVDNKKDPKNKNSKSKDLKSNDSENIKAIIREKFSTGVRSISTSLTSNPIIYFKYIILEYMITELGLVDPDIINNSKNFLFNSSSNAKDLLESLKSNTLPFFISKNNLMPLKTYPRTFIIVENGFKVTDIGNIIDQLKMNNVRNAFEQQIVKLRDKSSLTPRELNDIYNNDSLDSIFIKLGK